MSHIAKYFLAAIVTIASCGVSNGQEKFRIGVAIPLSGVYAPTGLAMKSAIEAILKLKNNTLGGQSVEIQFADDACDTQQAVSVARKFLADGVQLAMGHPCAPAALKAAEEYAANSILLIAIGASDQDVNPVGIGSIFRVGRPSLVRSASIMDYLMAPLGFEKEGDGAPGGRRPVECGINNLGGTTLTVLIDPTEAIDELTTNEIALIKRTRELPPTQRPAFCARPPKPSDQNIKSLEDFVAGLEIEGAQDVPKEQLTEIIGYSHAAIEVVDQALEAAGPWPNFNSLQKALAETEFTTALGTASFDSRGEINKLELDLYLPDVSRFELRQLPQTVTEDFAATKGECNKKTCETEDTEVCETDDKGNKKNCKITKRQKCTYVCDTK